MSQPRIFAPHIYAEGILNGNRTILAQAITLIESQSPKHIPIAEEVLHLIWPHIGRSIRVGITGVPGVGKSTFIEEFGCLLCREGHRVAVLAIDPSSTRTKGSIMGDKTRMEQLSNAPLAFIRPSPSGGTLGGVAKKTRESMFLCEAAGFDVILVETVGVGQSETTVRSMVDFFLLLMLAGAGDELQGIKRGIMELVDTIAITKADGDNLIRANAARQDYANAIHYLEPATPKWQPEVFTCSARDNSGLDKIWECIQKFHKTMQSSGYLEKRRQQQLVDWVQSMIGEHLHSYFYQHPAILKLWPTVEQDILSGKMMASQAVRTLLNAYFKES